MTKPTYSTILLSIGFIALMLTLPSARVMAQTGEVHRSIESSSSSTSSSTEVPVMEERRSVTRTTTEVPVVEDRRSITRTTTEATAAEKPSCANQCRDHYDRSMTECNLPDHPHSKKCEKWAREREKECLEKCYRE